MTRKPADLLREIWLFVKGHWPHFIAVIPMVIGVTVIHEAAHALAVIVQGGTVIEYTFMPVSGQWGHISYSFPPGSDYNRVAISIAPYMLWTLLAATAVLLAFLKWGYSWWAGSTIFVWMFTVPLADIANTAIPWLSGSNNDFGRAFGPVTAFGWVMVIALVSLVSLVGLLVQRRLYGNRALSMTGYSILFAITLILLVLFISGYY